MRTVRDPRGTTWICLELPEVPAEQREAAAALPADTRKSRPSAGRVSLFMASILRLRGDDSAWHRPKTKPPNFFSGA
jgi:hypothetical protein